MGTLVAALAEFTSFQYFVDTSSGARRPMPEVLFLAEAQVCTRSVTLALIQPSPPQASRPLVSVELPFLAFQAGWAVQREAVDASPVSQTSQV